MIIQRMVKYFNTTEDARIVIDDPTDKFATVYPLLQRIRFSTAVKLIKELKLKYVMGQKDYPRHGIGSSVYVKEKDLGKY